MKWLVNFLVFVVLLASSLLAQSGETKLSRSTLPELYPTSVINDPIREARILSLAKTTFPNLASQLNSADLLKRAVHDPSMRGNLRGRLAEEIFDKNFSSNGWKHVASKTAPQNDFWRKLPDGTLEGAQVKVHADVNDYIRSMIKDNKAEKFVVPDDHYTTLKKEYETRRLGALRGGNVEKAGGYALQSSRLMKLGRNFNELERAVVTSAEHYRAITVALQQAGKSLSFVGITVGVIEGSIATVEFAKGKTDVSTYITKIAKMGVGGVSSWYVGMTAAEMAASAGAVGLVPVAVAILVGGATYLVVDWGIDQTAKSLSFAKLTDGQLKMIWPSNVPLVPIKSLRMT
ncbi:MAG: hypothetical protein Q8M99_02645 [Methylotenera sp.]|nr:hypothetical protein [Methylotenera sp.]